MPINFSHIDKTPKTAETGLMAALNFYLKSPLAYRPKPVGIREVLFLKKAPCPLWFYNNSFFKPLFEKDQFINRDILKKLVQKGHYHIFIDEKNRLIFQQSLQQRLNKANWLLSTKSSTENANKQMSLLSLNMNQLMQQPWDNSLLNLQYSSVKKLFNFFLMNDFNIAFFYSKFESQHYHYSISHPLISSLILLAFLKNLQSFKEREIELLFITNYFKDIGNSLLPIEIFSQTKLSKKEEELISRHSLYSVDILENRISLPSSHLSIIANHHNHCNDNKFAQGIETALVEMIDILSAIISPRPYRKRIGLFPALQRVKDIFSDNYRQEFSQLVRFSEVFFSNYKNLS